MKKFFKISNLFFISLFSFIGAFVACLFILQSYVRMNGLDIKYNYACEPRPYLWKIDPIVGYRNQINLNLTRFGGVKAYTNSIGFRSSSEHPSENKVKAIRIVGLGDSVMWGTRVNYEDSFLGITSNMLSQINPNIEVINAGVVGYSTLQERLFFENQVMDINPNVVMVNFCNNDFFPTEDPFGNIISIYQNYFKKLLKNSVRYNLNEIDIDVMQYFLAINGDFWTSMRSLQKQSQSFDKSIRKILIEIPTLEMSMIARSKKIKFVYLLIPDTFPNKDQQKDKNELVSFLQKNQIEYLDFYNKLSEDPACLQNSLFKKTKAYKFLKKSKLSDLIDFITLGRIDLLTLLEQLGKYKDFQRVHDTCNFIDSIGHPSKKGNKLIAQAINEFLALELLVKQAP